MNHDMSQYALENGPDEPRMVPCWHCGGVGDMRVRYELPVGCVVCGGEGEIPADEVDEP